jgi:hypothetical protein
LIVDFGSYKGRRRRHHLISSGWHIQDAIVSVLIGCCFVCRLNWITHVSGTRAHYDSRSGFALYRYPSGDRATQTLLRGRLGADAQRRQGAAEHEHDCKCISSGRTHKGAGVGVQGVRIITQCYVPGHEYLVSLAFAQSLSLRDRFRPKLKLTQTPVTFSVVSLTSCC